MIAPRLMNACRLNAGIAWRECMGIEPPQPDEVRSRTVLKTVRATRLHPLPLLARLRHIAIAASLASDARAADGFTQARDRMAHAPPPRRSRRLRGRAKGTHRHDRAGQRPASRPTSAD